MADRFPLIVDSSNQNIKELPDGDSLLLGDSEKLRFGDGQDLDIYHDGSNSVIDNSTGGLYIETWLISGEFHTSKSGETSATVTHDGAVTLMYDNTTRFATTATGATYTGVATASTISKNNTNSTYF